MELLDLACPLQRSAKPGEGIVRIAQWDLSMVQAATGPDGPSAIIHRLLQLLKASAVLEVVGLAVHGHAHGLLAEGSSGGLTSRSSATSKLAQSRATLPMLSGPAGSTSTTTSWGGTELKSGCASGRADQPSIAVPSENWAWGGFATHDLVDQNGVFHAVADALKLRAQQTLAGQAMAAGAIDPEQLAAVVNTPFSSMLALT